MCRTYERKLMPDISGLWIQKSSILWQESMLLERLLFGKEQLYLFFLSSNHSCFLVQIFIFQQLNNFAMDWSIIVVDDGKCRSTDVISRLKDNTNANTVKVNQHRWRKKTNNSIASVEKNLKRLATGSCNNSTNFHLSSFCGFSILRFDGE